MPAPRTRKLVIELTFEAGHEHPLHNLNTLEAKLETALENGIKTSEVEIPAVLSANVRVIEVKSSI